MKINDAMVLQYGKCPGNAINQNKIVESLKRELAAEEKKLKDIILWEKAAEAMAYYKNAQEQNNG